MPPMMMTSVMPSAMIAVKVKLRVMLKRLLGLANVLVARLRNTHAATAATNTQKVCRERIRLSQLCCCREIDSSSVTAIFSPNG